MYKFVFRCLRGAFGLMYSGLRARGIPELRASAILASVLSSEPLSPTGDPET